jgi:hypothetical protein
MAQAPVISAGLAALVLSLADASPAAPRGPRDLRGPGRAAAWVLTDRAFGPVEVGMRVREAERAAGVKLRADPAEASEPCHYVSANGPMEGVGFMVEDGRITRIDVGPGPHKTAAGIGVGSTEGELREEYASLVETPGFYDFADRSLRAVSADGKHAVLFVVRDEKVKEFRSGLRASVEYVEGCQ